jgi:pseudaminic acid biosynthesis-associated methylase
MHTEQIDFWTGTFGKEYTDRNTRDQQEWDSFFINYFGCTKLEINNRCFGHLPKDAKILEVGTNTGMQLAGLQRMGFTNLYGIELQWYAVEKAKEYTKGINIIQGSGFDIPFKDGYFDLVITNGVLIHIAPKDLPAIMSEIVRCSKQYIAGFEYYAEECTDINYRGNTGFLWKMDYEAKYRELFPQLKPVYKQLYPYLNSQEQGNKDCMYLLEK